MASTSYARYSGLGGAGSGVISLNGETGAVTLVAGTGISITPAGQNITIASTVGSFGDLTTSSPNLSIGGGTGAVHGAGTTLTLTGASLIEATSSVLTISGGSNAVFGTGTTIAVKQATTAQSGYLSSSDWNTFNNKQSTITTLPVANGGTGTGTAFTAGSVVFAGASGVYTQNNSKLFWDNTNFRFLIGTATATPVSGGITPALQVQGLGNDQASLAFIRYANSTGSPKFYFGKTRSTVVGTVGTIVQTGDSIGSFIWAPDNGVSLSSSAGSIEVFASGTQSSTSTPGRMVLSTTAVGATAATSSVEIDNVGQVALQKVGAGLSIKEGSNAKMGRSTLVAGSVVVANTSVTAASEIWVLSQVDGGTPGFLRVSTRTAGTSFTITSSSGTDTSTVAWIIVEPS